MKFFYSCVPQYRSSGYGVEHVKKDNISGKCSGGGYPVNVKSVYNVKVMAGRSDLQVINSRSSTCPCTYSFS